MPRKATTLTPIPTERNRLLAALPRAELDRLRPHLKLAALKLGQVIYEPGHEMKHVYFPIDSIVSLLYELESGAQSEIAVVGNDGVIGVTIFMGGGSTPSRGVVQNAGKACQLPAAVMREEFKRGGAVQRLMLRYTQALIAQMMQTAVCNRHHSLEQQLCRWLLLSLDRLDALELVITQQLIGNLLGVRREGVTAAIGRLQKLGVISYRRKHLEVLDRARLEGMSCECYATVRRETMRLLPER